MIQKLIIGTVQFGLVYGITNKNNSMIDDSELDKIFKFCNDHEIYHFDTAQDYGISENILSKYCKIYSNFIIYTKSKFIDQSIENSLKKFKKIECFMFHSFNDYTNDNIYNQLLMYQNIGIIKYIGVSVYTVDEAIIVLKENRVNVLQIPFHFFDTQWFENLEFIILAQKSLIKIHTRSIFLQGLLLNTPTVLPSNIPEKDFQNLRKIINDLCQLWNLTPLELCIGYTNSFDWIDKFLIGIDNYKHLCLNIQTIKKNIKLTKDQITLLHTNAKYLNKMLLSPMNWKFN